VTVCNIKQLNMGNSVLFESHILRYPVHVTLYLGLHLSYACTQNTVWCFTELLSVCPCCWKEKEELILLLQSNGQKLK